MLLLKKSIDTLFSERWNYFFNSIQEFKGFKESLLYWDDYLESPIEARLYEQMRKIGLEPVLQCEIHINSNTYVKVFNPRFKYEDKDYEYSYRLDFAFFYKNRPLLNVECDGSEFHTTYQDRLEDQRRDENLKKIGFSIARFSGKEINNGKFLDFDIAGFLSCAEGIDIMVKNLKKMVDLEEEMLQRYWSIDLDEENFDHLKDLTLRSVNYSFEKERMDYLNLIQRITDENVYLANNPFIRKK